MRVAVIGSRNFTDYPRLKKALDLVPVKITEIVSGGAKGADSLAEKYAKERNIPVKVFYAKWKDLDAKPCVVKSNKYGQYNALAGHNRNTEIIERAELIMAFWDGKSRGTKDSIDKCMELGKNLKVVKF